MTLSVLFILSVAAAPATMTLSLDGAAETWLNDRSFSTQVIHLSDVKSSGDGLICAIGRPAFTTIRDKYLIDARRQVAWGDSVAFSNRAYSSKDHAAGGMYRMDRDRALQWAQCEDAGATAHG